MAFALVRLLLVRARVKLANGESLDINVGEDELARLAEQPEIHVEVLQEPETPKAGAWLHHDPLQDPQGKA